LVEEQAGEKGFAGPLISSAVFSHFLQKEPQKIQKNFNHSEPIIRKKSGHKGEKGNAEEGTRIPTPHSPLKTLLLKEERVYLRLRPT